MSTPALAIGHSSPVLVIGMHRSGTRVLADALGELGIFMGADLQADSESVTFMRLNEAILHQCGAFWSEPMPAHFVLADPDTASELAARTATLLERHIGTYLGREASVRDAPAADAGRCGWKDPRTTFTLPVWRRLFPGLKVIHMMRHGVDVAASLARRHSEAFRKATGQDLPGVLTVVRDNAIGILSSRRGWVPSEALTMWEQYAEKARLEIAELGANALEIRFEDLLGDPHRVIAEVAGFCEVPGLAEDSEFLKRLNPGRSFAYRQDVELKAFAESNRAVLGRFGYSP